MDDALATVLAVWSVLVVPFVVLAAFLATQDELTLAVVGLYWFPPSVLVVIGSIPPPWSPLVD